MQLTESDWAALDRLRDIFLRGEPAVGPYWRDDADLRAYDATFAQRIGWKWDAALAELARRGWRPPTGATVLDWGCGSGVAGRRVLAALGSEGAANFSALRVWDHSPLAREFAVARARERFPAINVDEWRDDGGPIGLLVLSHVLNELTPPARTELLALIDRAEAVLWVEPGTHAVSRDLIGVRETLIEKFSLVAPCPHRSACGLLAPGNERHWCHFFAPPPLGVHADSDWVRFAQRAGIDLRSLPYSWLALERTPTTPPPEGAARIIGRPEHFKAYSRLLSCAADGVAELEVHKRTAPQLIKQLERAKITPLYRWQRAEKRITSAEAL